MRRWVLASSNAGKLREFEHALASTLHGQQIELINQSALGITAAEEPHDTFEANALAKARHASLASGLPAIADDSGICVATLNGAPGVRSARYWEDAWTKGPVAASGQCPEVTAQELQSFEAEHRQDSVDERNLHWLIARINKALQVHRMHAEPPESFWDAAFVSAIAFVRHADDSHPIIVRGEWKGRVVPTPKGAEGFGYDPIFFDPVLGRCAAELTVGEKEAVSHRGRALRLLQEALASEKG